MLAQLKSALLFLSVTFFITCSNQPSGLFDDLIDQDTVFLYLKKYQLEEVPKEIGKLKNAEWIMVSLDSGSGWTVYPPVLEQTPPFKELPKEITELTKLRRLTLIGLNLKKLPDDFSSLKNLESLDLAMNKLTVSDEIEKLKKLRNLKYLSLIGNQVTADDVEELKKAIPGLTIPE